VTDRWLIAVNVKLEGKVAMLGAIWNGTTLQTVRAKAKLFTSLEEADAERFFVSCKYPLLMERLEVMRVSDDPEFRYHLRGGEDVDTR
jgi:hypothetical protein